jgi:phosphoglycerate dehydrogenase-like enzyme
MTYNAHFIHAPDEKHLEYLKRLLNGNIRITTGETVPADTQFLIDGRPSRDQLSASSQLTTLLIPFTGMPAVTAEAKRDFPQIAIHNLHHNAPMTAETAIMLMMAAAKHIVPVDRVFRTHDWSPRYDSHPLMVLDGKTALILGYGAIGQRIGAACSALGMRVLAIRRSVDAESPEFVYPVEKLHDLLPQAQVLMACLPGTPHTDGMIGETEIRLLPQGALVVNVGRAAAIDQAALYQALKDGHLFAAGLDVWYNYPTDKASRKNTPPADYPFHELDNVVMSPHHGGGGGDHEVETRRMSAIAAILNLAANGDAIPHRVNLDAGY